MTTKTPEKTRKERARFVADLFGDGKPLIVTVQRMKEVFDAETGAKQAIPDSGKYIRFVNEGNGIQSYETSDPDEIQLLRVRANEHGVFNEVPIPKPPSGDTLRLIVTLIAKRDTEALVKLAEQEEETHQRDDVLEAVAEALEALR